MQSDLCTLCEPVTACGGSPVLKTMVATMMGRKPSMRFTSSTCVTVYSHFSPRPGCFAPLLVAALSRHLQTAQSASGSSSTTSDFSFSLPHPCQASEPLSLLVLVAERLA